MDSRTPHRRWSDRRRIDLLDPFERLYWAKFFGVEEDDVLDAVDKVGSCAEHVRRYLATGRQRHWVIGGREDRRHPRPARRRFE